MADALRVLLCDLQDTLRAVLLDGRPVDPAAVVDRTSADTIYAIDRHVDAALVAWFEREWPAKEHPVELVTEAFDEPVQVGRSGSDPRWTCIVDPIDGTRGLMYDKRPAWVLGALAPFGGSLRDVVVAAMTELPTTKQWASDQISAVRGAGLVGERVDVRTGHRAAVRLEPSRATSLDHGWASFARFFPPGKPMLAAFEQTLWEELYGRAAVAHLSIFDDQYLATGGQFHELLAGRDRMLGDLRPLAFRALGLDESLACHPYDCCTAMLLEEAGCVVTDPWGDPLDVPLDTTTPVAWIGFANAALADAVRPALDRALARHFPVESRR